MRVLEHNSLECPNNLLRASPMSSMSACVSSSSLRPDRRTEWSSAITTRILITAQKLKTTNCNGTITKKQRVVGPRFYRCLSQYRHGVALARRIHVRLPFNQRADWGGSLCKMMRVFHHQKIKFRQITPLPSPAKNASMDVVRFVANRLEVALEVRLTAGPLATATWLRDGLFVGKTT